MEITVNDNQTLLDIAMQYYGNVESLQEILTENPQLENDAPAVIREGYEPGDFWPHIRLKPGQRIRIPEDSRLLRKNVTRKISYEVATYITEEWQEQLNTLNNLLPSG